MKKYLFISIALIVVIIVGSEIYLKIQKRIEINNLYSPQVDKLNNEVVVIHLTFDTESKIMIEQMDSIYPYLPNESKIRAKKTIEKLVDDMNFQKSSFKINKREKNKEKQFNKLEEIINKSNVIKAKLTKYEYELKGVDANYQMIKNF